MKKKKRLSGIERRWFVNNVGVIMLLVAACVLGVVFSMAAYYDTNLRSGLENKAKTFSALLICFLFVIKHIIRIILFLII